MTRVATVVVIRRSGDWTARFPDYDVVVDGVPVGGVFRSIERRWLWYHARSTDLKRMFAKHRTRAEAVGALLTFHTEEGSA